MIGQGPHFFQAQVNYTEGALKYIFQTPNTNWGKTNGFGAGWGIVSDAVYGGTLAGVGPTAATSLELTTAWSLNAGYEHFWNPRWKTSMYGGYTAVSYNSTSNSLVCLGTTAPVTTTCDMDWSTWWIRFAHPVECHQGLLLGRGRAVRETTKRGLWPGSRRRSDPSKRRHRNRRRCYRSDDAPPILSSNPMGLKRHKELASGSRLTGGHLTRRSGSLKQLQFSWADAISTGEWKIYRAAIRALRNERVEFLVGGGFARAGYTGHWRDTKDIDFYVRPQDRKRAEHTLMKAGFADYYEKLPYDRGWIYRSYKQNVIVDVIWAMANQRAQVDEAWFQRAAQVTIRGERLFLVPAEELLWCKLYVIQRDRCDWTDIFNLVHEYGRRMNWTHLIRRMEDDLPLMQAMLTVYGWLCPEEIKKLPRSLWHRLAAAERVMCSRRPAYDRIRLLDSRNWFGARAAKHQKLEV